METGQGHIDPKYPVLKPMVLEWDGLIAVLVFQSKYQAVEYHLPSAVHDWSSL